MSRSQWLWAVTLAGISCAGCGSDDDGGGATSCAGKGTVELSVGSYEGKGSVSTMIGSPSSTFSLLTDACTGNAEGSLYDIPSQPGTYSFTVPSSGSTTLGPNLTLGVPGPDYTLGFDFVLGCSPCGTGSVTVTESDAQHVAGTLEGTAWEIQGGPGGLTANPAVTLPVAGKFDARW